MTTRLWAVFSRIWTAANRNLAGAVWFFAGAITGLFLAAPIFGWILSAEASNVLGAVLGGGFGVFGALWLWSTQRSREREELTKYVGSLLVPVLVCAERMLPTAHKGVHIDSAMAMFQLDEACGRAVERVKACGLSLAKLEFSDCSRVLMIEFEMAAMGRRIAAKKSPQWSTVDEGNFLVGRHSLQEHSTMLCKSLKSYLDDKLKA